jgi:hypothetical protein
MSEKIYKELTYAVKILSGVSYNIIRLSVEEKLMKKACTEVMQDIFNIEDELDGEEEEYAMKFDSDFHIEQIKELAKVYGHKIDIKSTAKGGEERFLWLLFEEFLFLEGKRVNVEWDNFILKNKIKLNGKKFISELEIIEK